MACADPGSEGGAETIDLERARRLAATRAWLQAFTTLTAADRSASLGAADLELLATSAAMIGRDDDFLHLLERAHHAHLDAGQVLAAARCAFWVGTYSALRGQTARASGWLSRAERLVEREGGDCVERGYLLVPVMMGQDVAGDYEGAYATALEAAGIGERFSDKDLVALALHEQGRALAKQGRLEAGLELLDETMVAVTGGELSPFVTGLVYCSVIEGCHQVYELGRAREWTAALTRWCDEQPEMVSFTGRCLVHRAEIMQLDGAWPAALQEARRAGERFAEVLDQVATGEAWYRQGEIHRLQGEHALAEAAFREASRCGWEPQPGLALLRLAHGDTDAAVAAIRRVVGETSEPWTRARLLPAHVEIMLAAGELEAARGAARELEELAADHRDGMLGAVAAHARGAVALADGDAWAALVALRHACQVWQKLQAPFEAARVRALVGLACRALGDDDTATLELESARRVFAQLRAAPEIARLESRDPRAELGDRHGLTARELQVLRMVAAGDTNKAIAASLVLSERTVDRHVSNILGKLRVPSRAAATAYAYEHQLV
jgi:DNA-binding CsgD family transcriptional regulator